MLAARRALPGLREVVVDDEPAAGTIALDDLPAAPAGFDLERAWRAVIPQDVAPLIYMSGTTGAPKGVELTHANLMALYRSFHQIHPARPHGRLISWLPLGHLADRGQRGAAPLRGTTMPLTEREVEVARLVAESLSNRDAAERPVLSPRTIDGHRNASSKLGFRSRAQLAHG